MKFVSEVSLNLATYSSSYHSHNRHLIFLSYYSNSFSLATLAASYGGNNSPAPKAQNDLYNPSNLQKSPMILSL